MARMEFQALSLENLSRKLVKSVMFIDVMATFDAQRLRSAGFNIWRL